MRVLVIGGGIVGASAAYHLTEAGADVVVADRADPGPATAAGAGVVFPYQLGGGRSGWEPLVAGTLAHWTTVVDPMGPSAGVAQVGMITVGAEPELRAALEFLRASAPDPDSPELPAFEWLAPGEPADAVPVLRRDLAGLAAAGIRRVNGRTLRDRLLGAAGQRGAHRRAATARLSTDSGTLVVTIDGEPFGADAVIVAAGAWSAEACEPLGLRLPVAPERGQILHLDTSVPHTDRWPMIRAGSGHYLLGFERGRTVSGGTHEPDAGFDHRVTAAGVYRLLSDVLDIAPGLGEATVAEVRVGFRPTSTDGLPVLGRVAEHPQVVVATGLGASGLTFGPYVGSLAAELALGHDPAIDLAGFRPERGAASDTE